MKIRIEGSIRFRPISILIISYIIGYYIVRTICSKIDCTIEVIEKLGILFSSFRFVSIIKRHSSGIRSIADEVCNTLLCLMCNHPLSWLMSCLVYSNIYFVQSIRILIRPLITSNKIPIVVILWKYRSIQSFPISRLSLCCRISLTNATSRSRTKYLYSFSSLIDIHYLRMSSKRSRYLNHIYIICSSCNFTNWFIILLLELKHSIIIIYLISIKGKEVTSEIETLSINMTFETISCHSIPLFSWGAAATTATSWATSWRISGLSIKIVILIVY